MSGPSSSRGRPNADVISSVRRSILGVRTPSSGGTGWVVLANGLVLTSQEAVGYHTQVLLERETKRSMAGRVIWVDVARDLALILPKEPLGLPPILTRPDLPKLGEPVFAISLRPSEPLRVVSALVSSVDYKISSIRCFDVDAPLGVGGCPILDSDGRVIGIGALDLPRGNCRRPRAADERCSPALPITALLRALAAFDVTTGQFEDRTPVYRCPICAEPYLNRDDRCLSCGRALPHAWATDEPRDRAAIMVSDSALAFSSAERFVRDLLARLDVVASHVRAGPRSFRLIAPSREAASKQVLTVTIEIDEDGRGLIYHAPLVRIPSANYESFYRFLLTLNDETTGRLRLFIEDDRVHLGLVEPIALLSEPEAAELFEDLVRVALHYRKLLAEAFDARAIP